jgi:hypothetical protein
MSNPRRPDAIAAAEHHQAQPDTTMTPKQAAARLLLAATQGKPHPTQLDRTQMSEFLDSRISDEKRAKILEFASKIETPYLDRLKKLTGEGGDEAEAAAAPQA